MKNLALFILGFFLVFPSIAFSQDNSLILKSFHSISSNELLEFADELCSEKYKGRLSG